MRWHTSAPVRHPPSFIEPCLPAISRTVPTGASWAYEIKHDGFRFICRRAGDRVRVFSRRGHDWTDRVPMVAEALQALQVTSITIEGERVVCGPDGVSDFELLRAAVGRKGSRDAFLYAFDLLELDGRDLRREPWGLRRDQLVILLRKAADGIRVSEHPDGADGERCFDTHASSGWRASSPSGATGRIGRGGQWIGSR
jgi:bifunctional non-homologous end joining protein LigD